MHRYVLAGAAWEGPAQRATVVGSIPFTHPAHVPALLALLRHQCAINALLSSCIASPCDGAGTGDASFEIKKIQIGTKSCRSWRKEKKSDVTVR